MVWMWNAYQSLLTGRVHPEPLLEVVEPLRGGSCRENFWVIEGMPLKEIIGQIPSLFLFSPPGQAIR